MGFLASLFGQAPGAGSVHDERLWMAMGAGAPAASGEYVGPDTALKLSTVWACDRLLCETIGSLPALTYERLGDGGRKRATNHPLYDVLHRQPNAHQTPMEFFDFMTHCAIMRGNGYARIKEGRRGFADQLEPLHPDRVRPERLVGGGLRYAVTRPEGGTPEMLDDSQVLHLRGPSFDGVLGVSVVTYARESMGLGLAAEKYGARFFGNNARPGGILTKAGQKLSTEASKRLKEEFEELHAGANAHRVAVLEEGLTWTEVNVAQKDAQFLETREFQAEDICRFFRVPTHMVQITGKSTSWGTGIEQLSLAFVIYTLLPWLVRWQQAISRDLILAPDKYFVEFLVDALLRGDIKSRYEAYSIARNGGWYSRNDIRRKENENPIDGGDDYLTPLNMGVLGEPMPAPSRGPGGRADGGSAHYAQLVHEAAARVIRKEVTALGKAAKRGEDWAAAVQAFYADHASFVAQALAIPLDQAALWVAWQKRDLLQHGPAAMDDWETRRVVDLAELVLEA